MGQDQYQKLTAVIRYIEDHIRETITQEQLAATVDLSKFHLHRLFRAVADKPIMQYVRERKLAASLHDLKHTQLKIIDIAAEYGFTHEQSYIRAFRQLYDVTPARFRREPVDVTVQPVLDTRLFAAAADQIVLHPVFVYRKPLTLLGQRHVIDHRKDYLETEASSVGNVFFTQYAALLMEHVDPQSYYALVKTIPDDPTCNIYIPSFQRVSEMVTPDGLEINEVPGGLYARFRYVGLHAPQQITIHQLNGIYAYVFQFWSQHSVHRRIDGYHLEHIQLDRCTADYCEMDIYFPVQP